MYTGENKTALSSQRAFADAFVRLLREKPYTEITVSSLCQASGLSRQTFYTLFQCKENVLRYTIEALYCYPEKLEESAFTTTADAIAHVFSVYVDANYDFLKLLVQRELIFIFYDACCQWLLARQDTVFAAVPAEQRRYVSTHVISVFTGVINIYMSEPRREPQYLESLFYRLLSGAFF